MFNTILGIYLIIAGLTGLFRTIQLLIIFKHIETSDLWTLFKASMLWFLTIPMMLIAAISK